MNRPESRSAATISGVVSRQLWWFRPVSSSTRSFDPELASDVSTAFAPSADSNVAGVLSTEAMVIANSDKARAE